MFDAALPKRYRGPSEAGRIGTFAGWLEPQRSLMYFHLFHFSPRATSVAAAVAMLACSSGTKAAEYCVTCAEPAATYACVVGGSAADAPADPREQLICIAELAKSGGHASCSVPRSAPKPCPGILKIVAAPAGAGPTQPGGEGAGAAEPSSPAAETAPADAGPDGATAEPEKAPRTVEEMAEKTVQSSKEGIAKAGENVGKAGSAVGNAAKKTWDCIVSLFSDC